MKAKRSVDKSKLMLKVLLMGIFLNKLKLSCFCRNELVSNLYQLTGTYNTEYRWSKRKYIIPEKRTGTVSWKNDGRCTEINWLHHEKKPWSWSTTSKSGKWRSAGAITFFYFKFLTAWNLKGRERFVWIT